MERKRSRTTKGGGKHGMPAGRRNELGPEEIERHLRESKIMKMEPILAGTGYWGRAEGEFANAISDEKDPKRKKEMARRYEELAVQLKDLNRREREQILLEEITKWKTKTQKRQFSGSSES